MIKKHNIAFQFQHFLLDEGFFPEKQIYFDLQLSCIDKEYDIIFTKMCGSTSKNLNEVKKPSKIKNCDFSVLYGQIPLLDNYVIYSKWVVTQFLSNHEYVMFSLSENFLENAKINLSKKNDESLKFYNFCPTSKIHEPLLDFSNAKLFYIAFSDPLLRHPNLIKLLDQNEYVSFFGPNDKWSGIKNYRGSIPFESNISSYINQCGICLAIHSPIHEYYEINTTRIAEGCCAGSVIITNEMQHLKDLFGDSIFTIDFSLKTEKESFQEIDAIVKWVRSNPAAARSMALKSQSIFYENFLKEDWLPKFHQKGIELKDSYIDKRKSNQAIIDVLYLHQSDCDEIDGVIKNLLNQYHQNLHLIVVTKNNLKDSVKQKLELLLAGSHVAYTVVGSGSDRNRYNENNTGSMFLLAKEFCKGEYFTFIDSSIIWNADHLSNLLLMMQKESLLCAYSGVFYEKNGLRFFNTKFNNDSSKINNVYLPITFSNFMGFLNHNNLINLDYSKNLSDFENDVEIRFLKGNQIFSNKVLDLIHDTSKLLENTDGCEHIYLAILIIVHNNNLIGFFQQCSAGLKVSPIPKECFEHNILRYSLYPNRPLINTNYRRSSGLCAGGLFDIFSRNRSVLNFYSRYYTEKIVDRIEDVELRIKETDSRIANAELRLTSLGKKVFRMRRIKSKYFKDPLKKLKSFF